MLLPEPGQAPSQHPHPPEPEPEPESETHIWRPDGAAVRPSPAVWPHFSSAAAPSRGRRLPCCLLCRVYGPFSFCLLLLADWEEEQVSSPTILRLIYQGRFLHGNVTLGGAQTHADAGEQRRLSAPDKPALTQGGWEGGREGESGVWGEGLWKSVPFCARFASPCARFTFVAAKP